MISGSLLVLLGLVVWVIAYGPPDAVREAQAEARPEAAFAELAALFDNPVSPPDRTIRPR
jgi:hypothetical protein